MKKVTLIVMFVIAIFSSYAFENIEWERYEYPEFNFSVNIPKNFKRVFEPGIGALILTKDDVEIEYSGGYNVTSGSDGKDPLTGSLLMNKEFLKDDEIINEFKGKNYYILSGKNADGSLFYQRTVYEESGNKFVTFDATYPASEKEYMDKIIEKMITDIQIFKGKEGKEAMVIE